MAAEPKVPKSTFWVTWNLKFNTETQNRICRVLKAYDMEISVNAWKFTVTKSTNNRNSNLIQAIPRNFWLHAIRTVLSYPVRRYLPCEWELPSVQIQYVVHRVSSKIYIPPLLEVFIFIQWMWARRFSSPRPADVGLSRKFLESVEPKSPQSTCYVDRLSSS
jgi:hypothetical protein